MEKNRALKMNALVIVVVLMLALVALLVTKLAPRQITPDAGVLEGTTVTEPTEVPAAEATDVLDNEVAEETNVPENEAAEATAVPAKAYLIVTVAGSVYEPIPLYEEGRYTVRRGDFVNVIEVTEDSVKMAESSCDNQDCVLQGTVSLENRNSRVLQNMIICLPNDVALELYTYEEMQEVLLGWLGGQEE